MLRFRTFMIEYLTDIQRKPYERIKISAKARADTDHHFGKGNDIVHGDLSTLDHHHDKSETHIAVEHHLGKNLSHHEYNSGMTKDKYGRDAKLGKSIKDEKLRNSFASDKNREGSKLGSNFKTSTVRGIEVAGQTNSEPDKNHPRGHSWGELSCKNVDTGKNKNYLSHEVEHGTVVHRVHDHNGQEIYRATLQPHHDAKGNVVHDVNAEYGVKHTAFTKSAHETAAKLSTGPKESVYKVHDKVHNNKKAKIIVHPTSESHHLDKLQDHKDEDVRQAVAVHHNLKDHHLDKALNDKESNVRQSAANNPSAKDHHLDKALNDKEEKVRYGAANNLAAKDHHLDKALNDSSSTVRYGAANNPAAKDHHLDKALNDVNKQVRYGAANNTSTKDHHLDKALNDEDSSVRYSAVNNPNAKKHHLEKALNDSHISVKLAASKRLNH